MEVFEGEVVQSHKLRMMLNWMIWKEKMYLYGQLLYNNYIIPYREDKGLMEDI